MSGKEGGSSSCRDDSSTANSDPLCDIELLSEKSYPERQILVESGVNRVDLQDPKFWPRNCVDKVLKEFKTQDLNSLDFESSKRKIGKQNRYCSDTGTPVERFIQFLDNTGHKAKYMEASIVKILSNLNINIDDCRGQSYDNANNMSGVYSGLQVLIKSRNSMAKYVPCAAHSLNLIVQHAAECTMESITFFLVAEEIYVFFSASTYRWKRLIDLLKNCDHTFVPKRVNVTRWSGRFNALKALNLCYQDIKQAVLELSSNEDEKMPVRCQANNLHEKMATLEFGIYVAFWFEVLERTDLAIKSLQSANMDLHTCSSLYSSLQHFYESLRNKCNLFEEKGQLLLQQTEYIKEIRSRKRKLPFDEADTEEILTP
ncbi:zinc finger MYM-type protein 1-like [Diabrotica undecimpunctata]|uniref:zinc finger MYM-type protein 1-like n=1 Tax=Diabrotica undecimpunctata TaxID=50387 RepID=UPI003B635881